MKMRKRDPTYEGMIATQKGTMSELNGSSR